MIKGKLGKILVGASEMAEMSDWSYSGEVREVIEALETYDCTYIENFGGDIKGGDIEIKGLFKSTDTALLALIAAFDANTEYGEDDIKLYVNATQYLTPDDSFTPDSVAFLTKRPIAIEHAASGVVQVSMSLHVSGKVVLNTDT